MSHNNNRYRSSFVGPNTPYYPSSPRLPSSPRPQSNNFLLTIQPLDAGGHLAPHRLSIPVTTRPISYSYTYPSPQTGRSSVTLGSISASSSPRTAEPPILFYDKNALHYAFTNFSPHIVKYKGEVYPTSEHLFQSFKFEHRPHLAAHIRTCSRAPRVAFSEAQRFEPERRRDWRSVSIAKMEEAVYLKFTQHADLKDELLGTGGAELIEDSPIDSFWGVGSDGNGRNELGKALMRVRERIRQGH